MLLTQALAEKKLIVKKIKSKYEQLESVIARKANEIDPYADDGGAEEYAHSILQSINDLQERYVSLVSATHAANASNSVTIGQTTRSIAEWIVYKGDLLSLHTRGMYGVGHRISVEKQEVDSTNRSRSKDDMIDLTYAIPLANIADMNNILDTLASNIDSHLSIANATIDIGDI